MPAPNVLEMFTPAPAGFIRNAMTGDLVQVQTSRTMKETTDRKLLIVIQHYDGDVFRASDLGLLIGQLEPVLNEQADIMLFCRNDAVTEFSPDAVSLLRSRFRQVHVLRSGRRGAHGYPYGSNEMWHELVNVLGTPEWRSPYYAFLNLEADCCPTSRGWIGRLIAAFNQAKQGGKRFCGHFQPHHATPHFNGVCVYDTAIGPANGYALLGCDGEKAYDMCHAQVMNPQGMDTSEIVLDYKRASITAEELFTAKGRSIVPALYHGVQDDSAIRAVRERVLAAHSPGLIRDAQAGVNNTVFCYHADVPQFDQSEVQQEIAIWESAWRNCGWNPVVLGIRDAVQHPLYARFRLKAESFPTVNVKAYEMACWLRWLALSNRGGGLMTDYDVLPNGFAPTNLERKSGFNAFCGGCPCMVQADVAGTEWWIGEVLNAQLADSDMHDVRPHFSDQSLLQRLADQQVKSATEGVKLFPLLKVPERMLLGYGEKPVGIAVHFSNHSIRQATQGTKKRFEVMKAWLRGEA